MTEVSTEEIKIQIRMLITEVHKAWDKGVVNEIERDIKINQLKDLQSILIEETEKFY